MSGLTRPPEMTDTEASQLRARGGHVYQSAHDPRVSWLLNWFFGIVALLMVSGSIAAFSLAQTMRDQLRDLTSRPQAATAEQVAYLQRQIDEIKTDINSERARDRNRR